MFEYLSAVSKKSGAAIEQALYSAKQLKREILKIEPDLLPKIEFMNLLFISRGHKHRLTVPDLELISKYYGQLNAYLHMPRFTHIQNSLRVWESLYLLIQEIHEKLWCYVSETRVGVIFNTQALALFEDFKGRKKPADEIIATLRGDYGDIGFRIDATFRNFVESI